MTMIKAAMKAGTDPVNVQQMTSQEVLAKVAELKAKLELQKQKLGNVEGLSQFSMEMQAEHAGTLAMIEAEETLLSNYETFLKTGVYPDGTEQDFGEIQKALSDRDAGWHDASGPIEAKQFTSDKEKVGANYAGTILLENSGAYDPANPDLSNMLALVAGGDFIPAESKTVGKDIYVKMENGDVWVLKNMAVRPEDIVIYGGDLDKPFDFNASQVVRVSDGNWGADFGETFGLIVYGSGNDDRIVGSQGADVIMGGSGDDKIYGVSGDDRLFGDDFNEIGASGFGIDDGNDIIDGGAGIDTVKAGGGNEDKILHASGDSVSEHENPGATELYDQPDPASFISPATDAKYKDGTLVINADDYNNSTLTISMPPGYTIASAEPSTDNQAVVVTLAGFDVNGDAHTIRVKINGFYDPKNSFKFTFEGNDLNNIIDFSAVVLPAGVQANISGGKGDDTLLAPTTKLDSLGVDADELGNHTLSAADTMDEINFHRQGTKIPNSDPAVNILNWGIPNDESTGFQWMHGDQKDSSKFIVDGEIVLESADGKSTPKFLNFDAPSGYEDFVLMKDPQNPGDKLLVFINHTTDGTEQIVVRLKNIDPATAISVGGAPVTVLGDISAVSGGDGYDTIYASLTSATIAGEELVQGTYPVDLEVSIADNTTLDAEIAELEKVLTTNKETLTQKLQEKKDLKKEIDAATGEDKTALEEDMKKLDTAIAELSQNIAKQTAELKAKQQQQAGE